MKLRMLALTASLSTLCAAPTVAGTTPQVCHVESVPSQTLDATDTVMIPPFHPALGLLTQVDLRVDTTTDVDVMVENTGPSGQSPGIFVSVTTELSRPDSTSILSHTNGPTNLQPPLAAFDGAVDFAGPSGMSYADVLGDGVALASLTSPADLALFSSGLPVPLVVSAAVSASFLGTGATVLSVDPLQATAVTVCYRFQPVRASQCHSASIPAQAASWADAFTIPRFDPSLGSLQAALISFNVTASGSIALENPHSTSQSSIAFTYKVAAGLSLPAPLLPVSACAEQRLDTLLAPFDGTLDFDGPSGETVPAGATDSVVLVLTAPSDLAALVGTGDLALAVDATTMHSSASFLTFAAQTVADTAAELAVCYYFDPLGTSLCFGDGGDQLGCTDCPCSNNATTGSGGGCKHSRSDALFGGAGARLTASGSASLGAQDLCFQLTNAKPSSFGSLSSSTTFAPANPSNPCFTQSPGSGLAQPMFFDGLRCIVGVVVRHGNRAILADGTAGISSAPWGWCSASFPGSSAFVAGQTRYFQAGFREDAGVNCDTRQNTSQAVCIVLTP